MALYASPVLFALFVWWSATGAIFLLDGLPARTYPWSLAGATALMGVGFLGLAWFGPDTTAMGAFAGFSCGLLIWGWQEVAFLMGNVTGPRKHACPHGCSGLAHAGHAIQAILYHELALIAAAAAAAAICWAQPNQVGLWTFVILWVMRASAKLNLFLGVRNLSEEVLPAHLRYLGGFLTRRPMNAFFPVPVTLATIAAALLAQKALAAGATDFEATANTFLATLLSLAVLEHWFLVLPLPATALWNWSLGARRAPGHDGHPARLRCYPIAEPKTQTNGGVP